MSDREVITRGNLPHWYRPGAAHFVTYRLVDTLPVDVMNRLQEERTVRLRLPPMEGDSPQKHKALVHKQFFAAYDRYLDQAACVRWLQDPAVAQVIVDNLYHHHQVKYQLLEYVVMPNHVHVLFVPLETNAGSVLHVANAASVRESKLDFFSDETADSLSPLSQIMHSLKSYTSNEANKLLGRAGRFWQRESYDHWVRVESELARIAEYIAHNPVNAGLVKNAWDWPFCSAYDRKHPRAKRLADWW